MKRPNRWWVAACVVALAAAAYWYSANHLSEDEIAQTVRTSLQERLDKGEMSGSHMKVDKVAILHDQGNRYQAMATITLDGTPHDVPLSVLVDGKKVAWQSDAGAFAFVAQDIFKRSLADIPNLVTPSPSRAAESTQPAETTMPDTVRSLTDQWQSLNERCRGGSGDDPATQTACDKRDAAYAKIHQANWCWGHKDDTGADRRWVPCAPGDS